MTIIMTLFGMFVFVLSLVTKSGFKSAFKRLIACTAIGFVIDMLLLILGATVAYHSF